MTFNDTNHSVCHWLRELLMVHNMFKVPYANCLVDALRDVSLEIINL